MGNDYAIPGTWYTEYIWTRYFSESSLESNAVLPRVRTPSTKGYSRGIDGSAVCGRLGR